MQFDDRIFHAFLLRPKCRSSNGLHRSHGAWVLIQLSIFLFAFPFILSSILINIYCTFYYFYLFSLLLYLFIIICDIFLSILLFKLLLLLLAYYKFFEIYHLFPIKYYQYLYYWKKISLTAFITSTIFLTIES